MCEILRNTKPNQPTLLSLELLPLFPNAHTDAVIQPSVEFINRVLHACYSVIVHPTSDVDLDLIKTWSYTLTASPGREFSQMVFEPLQRLRMNTYINTVTVPSQCEAEELKISDCKHADNTAFLLVDL